MSTGARVARRFAAALLLASCGSFAQDAEYAMRWSPTKGGPAQGDEVAAALGISVTGPRDYTVRFFDVPLSKRPQQPWVSILRERASRKGLETTWKIRGPQLVPTSMRVCPLLGKTKAKLEADVTVLDGSDLERLVYSWSCSAGADAATAAAPEMVGRPVGCASKMRRWTDVNGGLKIERWTVPAGVLFEVSWTAKLDQASRATFKEQVVTPLLGAGAKPVDRSKTELGSVC